MKKGISRYLHFGANPAVCCLSVIFLSVFAIFTASASAQTLTATHSFEPTTYMVGSNLTVTTQIIYDGSLSAIGVEIDLPANWTYVKKGGDDEPNVRILDSGDLEFYWGEVPASTIDFTYTVNVPEQAIGHQEISAIVKYRRLGGEIVEPIQDNPLSVEPSPDNTYALTATHSSGTYIPDSNLTVNNRLAYTGFLSALGIRVELPEGWSYVSHQGDGDPNMLEVASGYLEFFWIEVPDTPITFTYTLSVPPGETGQQRISSTVLYRRTGGEYEKSISPDPLYISPMVSNGYIEGTIDPNVPTLVTTSGGGEASTTASGTFFMPHIAGIFTLTAQAEGYEEYTTAVTVNDMETTRVNVVLTLVAVDTEPTASITSPDSDVSIYEGESVDFYSTVTGGNAPFTYSWNFYGGFMNSNLKDPGSVTFHTAGTYNITFVVTDSDGDKSSDTVKVNVLKAADNTVPIASITSPYSNMTIFKGESVNFQGGVTQGNAPFLYSWNFDGGAVNSSIEDPGNVTFHRPGLYNTLFTVTDNEGDESSDFVRITVKDVAEDTIPSVSIMSPPPGMTIYKGESLDFQGTVSGGNGPFIYSWDFDGATPDANMEDPGNITFHTEDVYTITFTVSEAYKIQDRDSASVTVTVIRLEEDTRPVASIESPLSDITVYEGESVDFQGTVTNGNAPFIYLWEFDGAAATSNMEDPGSVTFHNAGDYVITFTVTEADKIEDTDTSSVTITVLEATQDTEPQVAIVSPPFDMTVHEGESVDFGGIITDGNAPFAYSWDFGGGAENSDLEDPRDVTFHTEGVYKVIFTVTDNDNDVDSDSLMITVRKVIPDTEPQVSISSPLSDMTINEGESINFQGAVTNGNAPFTYWWNFGEAAGGVSAEDPGNVTFLAAGVYTVTFTVTDSDGDKSAKSVTVTVKKVIPDTEPDVSIASPLSDVSIQIGESVNFHGTLTGGNAPFAYTWDFNGGAVNSDVEDPGNVTFETEGTYTVIFSVTDNDGDADSASLIVKVTPEKTRGYMITSELRIGAVIATVGGPIEAVWKNGGDDSTAAGDRVVWGYFYADPKDVEWGSYHNPELFVKIWFDRSGRIDVNYFHVSVPEIEVYSDYPYNDVWDWQGTTTMETRYIRQYYYEDGQSDMDKNPEDGIAAEGYEALMNPAGSSVINGLWIGSVMRTDELGAIDAVWRLGGANITLSGAQVAWGFFHADPELLAWGSRENPDVFVKVWFDVTGRIDVNFFHVSVPDIEVYSDFPEDGLYDQKGVTIMSDRYVRHEYSR